MEIKAENIYKTSDEILATLFLSLGEGHNILEVLSAAIYATQKFKMALQKLDIVPEEICSVISKEISAGAEADVDEELVEKLRTLLSEEGEE